MEESNRDKAIRCLRSICDDEELKPSDRIAAAKLLLEQDRPEEGNTITVIMEGVAKEYCG